MSHFDTQANSWDTPEKISFFETLSAYILKNLTLPEKGRVLDFGCGTGLFGLNFLNHKNELVGIDTSAAMLEVMNSKVDSSYKLKTYLLNLEEESIPEDIGSFDLIVSAMAFHHLNNPSSMVTKLKPLLREDGVLVVMDLDQEDGTFHPDNEAMGVKHYGFAKSELESWAQANQLSFSHSIYRNIEKNEREYGQFLAYFKN